MDGKRWSRLADNENIAQVPVLFTEIEAVPHDESILYGETDVVDLDLDLTPRRLAEQAGRPQRSWITSSKNILQVRQSETGIDNVFDDEDVTTLKARVQVLEQPYFTRGRRALRIARDGNEVEGNGSRHCARQVRQKDEGALQNRHEMELVGGLIVASDFGCHFLHARLNLRGTQQHGWRGIRGRHDSSIDGV